MTLMKFFGCFLTAYGPALSIFFAYVARSSHLVILCLASALVWLLSILLTGVIWKASSSPSVQQNAFFNIFIGATIQEVFRCGLFFFTKRVEKAVSQLFSREFRFLEKLKYSFVSGLGFGMASGAISYVNLLSLSLGPGMLPSASCPGANAFFITAITCMLFIFLHTVWQMITFVGFENKQYWKVAVVFLAHWGASFLTLLQTTVSVNYGCVISILLITGVLVASTLIALKPLKPFIKIE